MKSVFKYFKYLLKNRKQIKPIIISNDNNEIKKIYLKLISKSILCLNKKNDICFIKNMCMSCKIYNKYKHPELIDTEFDEKKLESIINKKKFEELLKFKNIISKKKIIILDIKNDINDKKKNEFLKKIKKTYYNILFLISYNEIYIEKEFQEICNIIKIKKKNYKNENKELIKRIIFKENNFVYKEINNENIIKFLNFIIYILKFLLIKIKNKYIKNLIKISKIFKKTIKENPFLNKNSIILFIKKYLNQIVLFSSL